MNKDGLVDSIGCPHCGRGFTADRLHFIARSSLLSFDHRLPDGQKRRFLPSRFTPQGDAIDAGGEVCSETACPDCHLPVPRLLALRKTLSFSIFGSPSSGKSYLLGAMSRTLRRRCGNAGVRFDDVDVSMNGILLDYESRMFNQPSPDRWVWLDKTGETGDWYSTVWYGPRFDREGASLAARNTKTFPKPFLFRLDVNAGHPQERNASDLSRVVCLYDNAGEHFQAADDRLTLVTSHLKHAHGLIFVYDPTQEPSFRDACRERSQDPQFRGSFVNTQDILYGNVMNRILMLRGMAATELVRTPLVVALTKFDSWRFLLGKGDLPEIFRRTPLSPDGESNQTVDAIDPLLVKKVSDLCRELLRRVAPQVVHTVESRCEASRVLYVPVSATGGPPEGTLGDREWPFHPEPAPESNGMSFFLAGKLRPMWAEAPMLALLHECVPGLVPALVR